jgi:hypothetical protein
LKAIEKPKGEQAMKIQTNIQAGGFRVNHNQTVIRAPFGWSNHNQTLVRPAVRNTK